MIRIFGYNETSFTSMGLGVIHPSTCVIEERLNGLFELTLEHPLDTHGKNERLVNDNYIMAPTPSGDQIFRIYKTVPTLTNVKVHAEHVTYELAENYVETLAMNAGTTASVFLNQLSSATALPNRIVLSTNISKSTTESVVFNDVNPLKAILNDDDDTPSFVKIFGGELVRNNFTLTLQTTRGQDRGVVIKYGKNLLGLSIDEDESKVVNRVVPIGDKNLRLPEKFLNAANTYGRTRVAVQSFSTAKNVADLRTQAQEWIDKQSAPLVNIKADIQLLSTTVEYRDLAMLETVMLGDILTVQNVKRNFSKKAKVISYKWDAITKRYTTVELGAFVQDISSTIIDTYKSMEYAIDANNTSSQVMQLLPNYIEKKGGVSDGPIKIGTYGYSVASYPNIQPTNGGIRLLTPITRYNHDMYRVHFKGYQYQNAGVIDIVVVFYCYTEIGGTLLQYKATSSGGEKLGIKLGYKNDKLVIVLEGVMQWSGIIVDAVKTFPNDNTIISGWSFENSGLSTDLVDVVSCPYSD